MAWSGGSIKSLLNESKDEADSVGSRQQKHVFGLIIRHKQLNFSHLKKQNTKPRTLVNAEV